MKTQKTNTKKYIIIFLIFFALPIAYQLFKHFNFFKPSYTTTYDPKKEVIIEKGFSKSGCYELGFWSSDEDLHYRMHNGKFEIAYYRDDTLLKKKILIKENQSGYSMKGGFGSHIALDTIKMPYDGKYSKLKIIFKTLKEDSIVSKNNDIDFYINKSNYVCGKEAEYYENKKVYPITKAETNETLKPLFEALVKKETQKVKEIIKGGISADVLMIGERRPIHYASFLNNTQTLQYLIDKKVDLNKKDLLKYTPLHYAIENNATKTVKILLENGADLKLVDKVTDRYINKIYYQTHPTQVATPIDLLDFIIRNNLVEIAKILFKNGLDVNYLPKNKKYTALNYVKDRMTNYNYYKETEIPKGFIDYTKMIILIKLYGAKTYDELQQDKNTTTNKETK